MELRVHRLGTICLPPIDPSERARAFGDLCRRTCARAADTVRGAGDRVVVAVRSTRDSLADTVRRQSATARVGLYSAAGTATATAASLMGMEPSDAVSLGMNVAATAAAFWPPSAGSSPSAAGTVAC